MKRALNGMCALMLAALVLWLGGSQSQAYVSIRVPNGHTGQALPVRWDLGNVAGQANVASRRVRYEIGDAGCADRAGFTGPVNEFEAVQNSFAAWRNVAESELDFEFAGATASGTSASDGRNVIRWVGGNIAANVFAVTITTFDTTTARITDADMELNDRDFTWDTLGPTGTQGVIARAMIENVVTHEIGHFVGLDHAANSHSSLYFQSAPGLINSTTLEVSDRAPIIADHPNPDFSDPTLGRVQGLVDNGTTPQFGVEVLLLDLATGRNVTGGITEGSPGPFVPGSFDIRAVPPGNYAVLCWPTNRQALGAYYTNAFVNFFPVVGGVGIGTIGAPALVRVAPGATVTGVNVSLPAIPTSQPFEPNNAFGSAVQIDSGQVAVANITSSTDQDWFKFTTTQAGQTVHIRVMADVMGSSLNPTLAMFDTNGTSVLVSPDFGHPAFVSSANNVDSTAFDLSGPNFDAAITRVMGPAGTYFVRVAGSQSTTGNYVLFAEIEGEDVTPDVNQGAISASAAGVPAGGANFNVTITPRNAWGRDINAPETFTVELMDLTTGTPVLMDTLVGSTPFTFSVAAQATSQVRRYGARIDSVLMNQSVSVSHYGAIAPGNSRVRAPVRTVSANGYDRVPLQIELRDGSNNPFRDPAAVVLVSTTLGLITNGTQTASAGVAATYDAAAGVWRASFIAPDATGTATISATVGGNALGTSATITALTRAFGTGIQTPEPKTEKDDDGGCAVAPSGATLPWLLVLLLGSGALAYRVRSSIVRAVTERK